MLTTGVGRVVILKCICMFVTELGKFPDFQSAHLKLVEILETPEFPGDWILKKGNAPL